MAYTLLGRNFVPPDVHAKVTGRARYAEDYRTDGMLFCRLLTSPLPHARVTKLDVSNALAMDGVIDVLTTQDVPSFEAPAAQILTNEPLFIGDPILAIAAVDETTAQNAIERIEIELEPLPFTVDPLESLYPGGPDARSDGNMVSAMSDSLGTVKWTARDFAAVGGDQLPAGEAVEEWAFGDLDAGFADAALVLDETFVTAGVSHHSMEPRTTMAYWQNGKCFLHGSTQSQTAVMPGLPALLGVGLEDIVYIAEYCGGGFGSKARAYPTMAIPALLAKRTQRPVMLRISRAEEFYVGSARPGFQGRIRMGFRADGRVTAVDLFIVQENGPYGGFDDFDAAASAVTLLYQPLSMRFRAVPIETNTPPRGAMRGPGENQIAVAVEPLIDKAAAELGIDRVAIRRVNAADNSAKYYADQGPVTSAYQAEALDKGLAEIDWDSLQARSGQRSGSKVIGVGVGQAFHPAGRNGYDGLVRLLPDGKLHIHSGAGNLGTYSHSGTSRVAAEVLKCSWENCVVERGDSRKHLPWSPTQSGSNTSFTMTRQNYVAAMDVVDKLKEIAAMDLGGAPADYEIGNETVFRMADPSRSDELCGLLQQRAIELGGKFSGRRRCLNDIHEITRTAVAGVWPAPGLVGVAKDNLPREGVIAGISVGFIEIELDLETGKYEILQLPRRLRLRHGAASPEPGYTDEGRGGAGLRHGRRASGIFSILKTASRARSGSLQCKPPSVSRCADRRWTSTLRSSSKIPQNPVGAKGMGEPPLGCAAAALVCAISDALGGQYFNRTPIVPDMIVNAVSGQGQSHGALDVNTA